MNQTWPILGVIAVILLLLNFKTRNSVWGGLTLGVVIGLLIAVFIAFGEGSFSWYTIGKFAIVGVLLGFAAELLGKLSDYLRKN